MGRTPLAAFAMETMRLNRLGHSLFCSMSIMK